MNNIGLTRKSPSPEILPIVQNSINIAIATNVILVW